MGAKAPALAGADWACMTACLPLVPRRGVGHRLRSSSARRPCEDDGLPGGFKASAEVETS
jgi:hypothetical protein